MPARSLSHLSDPALAHEIGASFTRRHLNTSDLLLLLAEAEERQLYLPAAYPSLCAWCVGEHRLTEDVALKWIRGARAARRCPALFAAVEDGRLHLTAVILLAPHLTPETVDELILAAAYQSKSEIRAFLALRFPSPASHVTPLFATVDPDPPPAPDDVAVAGPMDGATSGTVAKVDLDPPVTPSPDPRTCELKFRVRPAVRDKLKRAKDLLGHAVPNGDPGEVLDRALDALIPQLERRKFAATDNPRPSGRRSKSTRYIPADVRRAVRERDGGQCTFVSANGRRCESRGRLEYDHVQPVGKGGVATVKNTRLLCRAHNQYAAEQAYGADFMRGKREQARAARQAAKEQPARECRQVDPDPPTRSHRARTAPRPEDDFTRCLRELRYRKEEIERARRLCADIPDAPLEQRVKFALSCLAPQGARRAGSLPRPAA